MKALLKFMDGGRAISSVYSSESAGGDVYVLDRIFIADDRRGRVEMKFSGIVVKDGREIAEYREVDRANAIRARETG